MELRTYWAILRRRWAAPVLLTVLVALFSAVQLRTWEAPAPAYSVTIRMLVGVLPLENADGERYDPRYFAWLISEYLVDDFTEVLGTEMFADAVNARLTERGLSIPPGLIRAHANTGRLHRVIRITFTWHDAEALRAIAEATVAELEENADFYFSQLGTQEVIVRVLDSPSIQPIVGRSARERVEWPMRILLAIAAGTGVAFLREYLDDTVRGRDELEGMGLPTLAEIPRRGGIRLPWRRGAGASRRQTSG